MVYDEPVDLPGPSIPQYHTFQAPPEIPTGYYAIMQGGWQIVQGEKPIYPPPPPVPTQEEIAAILIENIKTTTQKDLDDFARSRNYDDILSLCTYVTSNNPQFAAEGQRGVNLRDSTWATLYTIMGEVLAGVRPMPASYEEIKPELPELTWV
jgi:hypothetical protein